MLRITTARDQSPATATLEGRLAGPWVDELRIWWESECLLPGVGPLLVDMSDLAFIDADGRALLEWMCRHGVELRAHGCMTRAIRDEIVQAAERKGVHRPPPARTDGTDTSPGRPN
jgi:hypothetical protein